MLHPYLLATASAAVMMAACADAPVSPVAESSPPRQSQTPPQTTQDLALTLYGIGGTTEFTVQTPTGEQRSVASFFAASPQDLPVGVRRDTTLQFLFSGFPTVGERSISPPTLQVKYFDGKPFLLTGTLTPNGGTLGTPDLVLFIWPARAPFPVRELVQSEPATLTITQYAPADPLSDNGTLRGHVSFTADEWVREWAPDGAATIRNTGNKVRVNAEFRVTWRHRVQTIDARPPR